MFHLLDIGKRLFPGFNKRVHSDNDGYEYCDRRQIYVHESELSEELGEYFMLDDRPVIVLNRYLDRRNHSWVFFHEIGHDMFHCPMTCKFDANVRRKIEKEANTIAAILMMPKELIISCTDWEIINDFGYPRKLVEIRRKIFLASGD